MGKKGMLAGVGEEGRISIGAEEEPGAKNKTVILWSWAGLEPDLGQQDIQGACLGQKDLSKVK